MPDAAIPALIRPARAVVARPAGGAFPDGMMARAVAAARIGIWECRLGDEGLTWTDTTYDLFGLARGSRLHRSAALDCYAPDSRARLERVRGAALAAGRGFRLDAEIATPQGERRWIRITAALASAGGRPVRLFGTKQDVTAERAEIARLRRSAEQDAMTGLANRAAFDARLAAVEAGPAGGALLLVDLDGFKQVNDGFGHALGDVCLVASAARLARTCAEAGHPIDLVARIGGDEFAVLLPPGLDRDAPERLAARIVAALGRPVQRDGIAIRLGASVGLARHGSGPDLFAGADRALYAAKAAGRNTVRCAEASAARQAGVRPGVPAGAFVRIG